LPAEPLTVRVRILNVVIVSYIDIDTVNVTRCLNYCKSPTLYVLKKGNEYFILSYT